ncbi:hypothetical protein DFQ27_009211 [Actinomortierella ambigua]|uniref:Uncharacterized protein n=1 Tax=Actinomortierella ambigua TaxID=1343610 RepID=A0A9P6TXF0_9FUNG|nr:hypothetical protein DFQ27_009211 [Actinomortierella ambigua]
MRPTRFNSYCHKIFKRCDKVHKRVQKVSKREPPCYSKVHMREPKKQDDLVRSAPMFAPLFSDSPFVKTLLLRS